MPSCVVSMDFITKVVTICVCLLIIAASLFNVITLGGLNVSTLILSIYFIMFAIMLIIAECKVRTFLKYFRLLAWKLGKALYCIIIGGLMIQTTSFGLTMVCAFVVFGLGCYYIFMHFIYKKCKKGGDNYMVTSNKGSAEAY